MNRWIAFVIALLVANALAVVVLIVKSGDPSDRIVPDYYQRAVEWDQTVAALRASDELGWNVEPRLDGEAVELAVLDGAGAAVTGASGDVTVHHQSVATGAPALVVEIAPGRYRAEIGDVRAGLNVIAYRLRRGAEHLVGSRVVERGP